MVDNPVHRRLIAEPIAGDREFLRGSGKASL